MRHFRSIVLIFAILLQALPGAVGLRAMGMSTAAEAAKCDMDCCAWIQELEQQEADSCTCSPASEEQLPTTPPIPSQSTRDVVPALYWKAQEEALQPAAPINEPSSTFAMTDAQELATPHVRLPVLFCAILI